MMDFQDGEVLACNAYYSLERNSIFSVKCYNCMAASLKDGVLLLCHIVGNSKKLFGDQVLFCMHCLSFLYPCVTSAACVCDPVSCMLWVLEITDGCSISQPSL